MPARRGTPAAPSPGIDVRRAADRFETRTGWLRSAHSFSFGRHYDPANTHFGLLLASNDEVVAPGAGFETHAHRDTEVVTWVLDGSLVHRDSRGHGGVVVPGLAQRMTAGSGILHSERNDAPRLRGGDPPDHGPVRFVQMWVRPDEDGAEPGYEQRDIATELARGGLVTVASGRPRHHGAIGIRQRHAALHAALLSPGERVALPDAPFVHLYAARGAVAVEGAGPLDAGDAVRITGGGGQRVTAGVEPAEVLVWEMHATLG